MATTATLKDVLKAVSRIEDELARVRGEMATKIDLAKLDAKVDAHRAETAEGFANLERELEGHADPVHADLEADIVAIHEGLVRANIRGIPKELPSQGEGRTSEQGGKEAQDALATGCSLRPRLRRYLSSGDQKEKPPPSVSV